MVLSRETPNALSVELLDNHWKSRSTTTLLTGAGDKRPELMFWPVLPLLWCLGKPVNLRRLLRVVPSWTVLSVIPLTCVTLQGDALGAEVRFELTTSTL